MYVCYNKTIVTLATYEYMIRCFQDNLTTVLSSQEHFLYSISLNAMKNI